MKLSELNDLTFDNVGSWPAPVKGFCVVLVFAALLGLGWYLDLSEQQAGLEQARERETALKQTFEARQRKAANLEPLKRQLADIEQTFGDMLKRLPNRTEVAGLLVDISQQGLGAGLEFELFRPEQERPADFYVELPIQVRVSGDYHQFGEFISGVSDLPRIVTSHDIRIRRAGEEGLVMDATAKTYRYMDEEEEAARANAP